MSTVPETSFDLQVPQTPFRQENGIGNPLSRAIVRTVLSATPDTMRLDLVNERVTQLETGFE
jgi:hypothetical protein